MKNKIIKNILTSCLLLFVAANVTFAANKYWFGGAGNWLDSTPHWSTATNGGGTTSTVVPAATDVAIFDANSGIGTVTINTNVDLSGALGGISMGCSTITITQGAYTMSFGTGNAVFSAGTFTGGNANITSTGNTTISGATFNSTSGILQANGNFTNTGTFNAGGGTVKFAGAGQNFTGNTSFNNMEFVGTDATQLLTIDPATIITVNGLFTFTKGRLITGNINAKGNVFIASNINYGASTTNLSINGTGTQNCTISGTTYANNLFNSIVINNSSATVTVLGNSVLGGLNIQAGTFNGGTSNISCSGITTASGAVLNSTTSTLVNTLFVAPNTTTVVTLAPGTFNNKGGTFSSLTDGSSSKGGTFYFGGNILNNLGFTFVNGGTYNLGDDLYVDGTVYMDGTQGAFLYAYGANRVIHVKGNVYKSAPTGTVGNGGAGGLILGFDFCGTGTQTLSGITDIYNAAAGIWNATTALTNKPSGTLKLGSNFTFLGDVNIPSGWALDTAGYKVTIDSHNSGHTPGYFNMGDTVFGDLVFTGAIGNVYLTGTTTVTGKLTFFSTGSGVLGNYNGLAVLDCKGDVDFSGGRTMAGNILLKMSGSANQTLTTTVTVANVFYCNFDVNKTGGVATLATHLTIPASLLVNIRGGAFDLNGSNFSVTTDSSFNNYGLLKLRGTEIVSVPNNTTTSTVKFTGTTALNIPNWAYSNLEIASVGGTGTFTLTAANRFKDVTLSSGTFNTNNFGMTVTGNWTNGAATFNPGTGTVYLAGTTAQTIQSGAYSFYNLNITNFNAPITFADSATITNAFTSITGGTSLVFNAGSTYALANPTLTGTAANNIRLRSSTSGTPWTITPSGTVAITNADVKDSAATVTITPNTGYNAGGNSGWVFGASVDRFWVGGTDGNWSTGSNWSTISGGADSAGAPTGAQSAIFDNNSTRNCTIAAAISIGRLNMLSTVSSSLTLIQLTTSHITIASGADFSGGVFTGSSLSTANFVCNGPLNVSGGTFFGGSGSLICNGSLSILSGNFTSTSGTLTVSSSYNFAGGVFNHNNGTLYVNNQTTLGINPGSADYYNVYLYMGIDFATWNLSVPFKIQGNLTKEALNRTAINGEIWLTGGTNQTVSATGRFLFADQDSSPLVRSLIIAKTGGNAILGTSMAINSVNINSGSTLDLNSTGLTLLIGNGDFINNGTVIRGKSLIRFYSNALGNYTFTPGSSTYDSLSFSMTGGSITAPAPINMAGNYTFEYRGALGGGPVVLTGGTNQTIGGKSTGSYTAIPLTISKSGGAVVLSYDIYFTDVTINSLSALNLNGYSLFVNRNFTNNASPTISSTGTVQFGKSAWPLPEYSSTIIPGSVSYPNVAVDAPAGNIKTISGTLYMAGNYTHIYRGVLSGGGGVVFIGTTNQTIIKTTSEVGYPTGPITINNNTGTVILTCPAVGGACAISTLTINPGSTVSASGNNFAGTTVVNYGTFTTGTGGVTCTIQATTFTNNGTVQLLGNEPTATGAVANITTFNSGVGSTVKYSIASGTTNFTLPGWWNYSNLEIAAGTTNTFSLTNTAKVFNSIALTSGTLNVTTANTLLTVTGNWTIGTGAFAPGTGTVYLAGTAAQTVSAGGAVFNSLNILNTSEPVTFANSLTTSTFVATAAGANLKFSPAGGTGFTIANLTVTGASGNNVSLSSVTNGSPWNLNVSGNKDVSYTAVRDSNSANLITPSANSANLGGNTNWNFGTTTAYVRNNASFSGRADRGAKVPLLKVAITPSTGENVKLSLITVHFTDGAGTALDTVAAQALFENILLVADSTSSGTAGTYQSAFDTTALKTVANADIALTTGSLVVTVDSPSSFPVNNGTSALYFLVAEMKATAAGNFKVNLADTDFKVLNLSEVPQTIGTAAAVSSTVLTAHTPALPVTGYPKLPGGTVSALSGSAYNYPQTQLYVGSTTGTIYALNADGTDRWNYPTGPLSTAPVVVTEDGGTFIYIAGGATGIIYKVKEDGTVPSGWPIVLGAQVISQSIVDTFNKTMYVGAGNTLYKLDTSATPATTLWSLATTPVSNLNSVSVVDNASIHKCWIGSENGSFYHINSASGQIISTKATGAAIKSSPFLDGETFTGTNNLFITSTDGKIYCVSATNFTSPWPAGYFDTQSPITTTPYVDVLNNAVYFGTDNGKIYKLNATTGAQIFAIQTGAADRSVSVKSSPLVYNGVVYFGSDDGKCYALDTTTGVLKDGWPKTTGAEVKTTPALGGWNGSAYTQVTFTSMDGKVYGLQIP